MRQQVLANGRQILTGRHQAKARSSSPAADVFGPTLAAVGMLAITGAALGSGVDPLAAAHSGGGGMLDLLSYGHAGGLDQATANLQQSPPARPQTTSPMAAAGGGFQTESYAFTCPSGAARTLPLRFKTYQCRAAMIVIAKTCAGND